MPSHHLIQRAFPLVSAVWLKSARNNYSLLISSPFCGNRVAESDIPPGRHLPLNWALPRAVIALRWKRQALSYPLKPSASSFS